MTPEGAKAGAIARPRDLVQMDIPTLTRPVSVLVVDDEAHVVELICEALRMADITSVPAYSAAEAMRHLDRTSFDVVLTDLRMPHGDGRSVLAQARRNPVGPEVIVLTGTGDVSTAVECMRMGAFDYIQKPFDVQTVTRVTKSAADKRRFMLETRDLKEVLHRSKYALMVALQARDSYTFTHCVNVAYLAKRFGEHLGCPQHILDAVTNVGELHDVGKIGVADNILNKPGPLTESEYESMKFHPAIGIEIVDPIGTFPEEGAPIRSHHERWDGSGYPDGLAGEDIPLVARITAVVDVFDAVTTDRPYRRALSLAEGR